MNTWTEIKLKDLSPYLFASQIKALCQLKEEGEDDPLPVIIEDTVARVRAEIAANPKNRLCENEHTVPQELKAVTCYLILESLQGRVPGLVMGKDQARLAHEGRRFLVRVSKGLVPIMGPRNSGPSRHAINVVNSRWRDATGKKLIRL